MWKVKLTQVQLLCCFVVNWNDAVTVIKSQCFPVWFVCIFYTDTTSFNKEHSQPKLCKSTSEVTRVGFFFCAKIRTSVHFHQSQNSKRGSSKKILIYFLSFHSSSLMPSYPWSRKERTPTLCQSCPRNQTSHPGLRYSITSPGLAD